MINNNILVNKSNSLSHKEGKLIFIINFNYSFDSKVEKFR